MQISIRSLSAITIYPNHSAGDRSGLHRCETSGCTSPAFGRPGSFQPATMPSADFCCVMVSPYGLISPKGQRSRSPGVNTYLSAHKRRVYAFGLRWIEDFALCCRLVPPKPPQLGSCTSPRAFAVPWLSAGRPPLQEHRWIPGCHTAIPFASIRLGLGLAEFQNTG